MCPASALLDPAQVVEEALEGAPAELVQSKARDEDRDWELPKRQMVECVCAGPSVGGQSLLECLIKAPWQTGIFTALIDAARAFDPVSLQTGPENHFLWVQVKGSQQLVRALDIILRDDNFAFVAADLRGLSNTQLQAVPPFVWYRLQRLAHQRAGGCMIFTSQPSVRCADRRISLRKTRCLQDLDQSRKALLEAIKLSVQYRPRSQTVVPATAMAG